MPPAREETKSTGVWPDGAGPRRLLAFWEGGSREFLLPKQGSLDIGRSQACQLRVDHASVSRRHVVWHAGEPDCIEDLGSSNGTRLNGQRIVAGARIVVRPGDTIEIGRVLLALQGEREARAEPAPEGAMDRVRRLVELAGPTSITVLLLGETGVGKDVIAERIHRASGRASGPFLRINIVGLAETLLESELFGHERGAFTGAAQAKVGLLEAASGGTVLLDEIGEMPLGMQAKLLVALERREVLPVGGIKPRAVDVRFIAATNRDLLARVEAGEFRRDLFYRLNGVTIRIPPLRERAGEIDALAREFVDRACDASGRPRLAIDPEALALLRWQRYPGNVRELRNLVERAVAFASGATLDVATLELALAASGAAEPASAASSMGLRPEVEALERQRIFEALERCGGNQTKAAALLGMPRRTLVSHLSRYGVTRPRRT